MKIAISANGYDLDAPFVPVFGRCPVFVLVDTETLACEAIPNQATMAAGGAGIQAAQLVANKGAEAIITGAVGPNAYQVLAAAGIPTYVFSGPTVREAVNAYLARALAPVASDTGPAHAGMGARQGLNPGRGQMRRAGPGRAYSPPSDASGEKDTTEQTALRAEIQELSKRLAQLEKGIDEPADRK